MNKPSAAVVILVFLVMFGLLLKTGYDNAHHPIPQAPSGNHTTWTCSGGPYQNGPGGDIIYTDCKPY